MCVGCVCVVCTQNTCRLHNFQWTTENLTRKTGSWNLSFKTTACTLHGPQSRAITSLPKKLAWKMKSRTPEPAEEKGKINANTMGVRSSSCHLYWRPPLTTLVLYPTFFKPQNLTSYPSNPKQHLPVFDWYNHKAAFPLEKNFLWDRISSSPGELQIHCCPKR